MNSDWLYNSLISFAWLAWAIYWFASSRWSKPTRQRETRLSRFSHTIPLALGVVLIIWRRTPLTWPWLSMRLLPAAPVTYWTGIVFLFTGLGFTVWARLHLGKNWSGSVTLKEGHELIRSGPYAMVRHPIYTGLLLAMLGCAMARGELRAAIGFVIAAAALIRKSRIEERWMRGEFGEQYERYREEVPAIIPRVLPKKP